MKFMHGQWMFKENIVPTQALEYISHEVNGNELVVYANSKHIQSRGDVTTHGVMTVSITSPVEDVVRVGIKHHFGAVNKGPFPAVKDIQAKDVEITEDEKVICYRSGNLTARIGKAPFGWKIEYVDNKTGELLTKSAPKDLAYMVDKTSGCSYMTERLALENGELVYGLGERFTNVVRNGQNIDMWNEDGGTQSDLAYKNVPLYLTSRNYGVYVESTAKVSFEVASESVEKVRFSVEGEDLAYYVIKGTDPKDVLSKYTAIMGRPALPPSWTFGMWMSSCYKVAFDENSVVENVDRMQAAGIPISAYHLDFFWSKEYKITNFIWNPDTFKDPDQFAKNMHDRNVRINLWIHPYIPQRSEIFAEGLENGYFIKRTDGSVWQTDNWQAGMAIVDFTNPAAYKWWQDKIRGLMENKYADSIAADFSEAIPTEGVEFFDGSDPKKMHNYYSYLYNKCVFEAVESVAGKNKAFCLFRSGSAGSQQFPCHWGGDPDATYKSMAAALRAGLSAATSGFCFWTHDVTGFGGKDTPDLYKRWCAFGLLLTHTRLHGEDLPKEPWNYDEECVDVLKKFSKLKCQLMPYIYGQANVAHEEGIPVLRPMFFEFPEDMAVGHLDTQYMFGDKLLVAPIMNDQGRAKYYLPEGTWTNYITGKKYAGGKWQEENYDYFSLPLMVRPNSIIVSGADEKADYDFAEAPVVELYELEDGKEATAKIPGMDGGFVAEVTASRSGNKVTVSMKGEVGSYKIFVSNAEAANVSAGNAEQTERGAVIADAEGTVTFEIR